MLVDGKMVVDEDGSLYPVIAGGDEEPQPEGSENLAPEGGEAPPDEPPKGPIPYERFSQVLGELKAAKAQIEKYSQLGDPEKVAQSLARLKELEGRSPYTDNEIKAIEERLLHVPLLRKMVEFIESQERLQQESSSAFLQAMRQETASYMKELGLEFKDEAQRKRAQLQVEAILAETIKSDPSLLQRWRFNDKTVLRDAIRDAQGVLGLLRRTTNAQIQKSKAPIKPVLSRPPAPKESESPKDPRDLEREILDKAAEKGFAMLQEREG